MPTFISQIVLWREGRRYNSYTLSLSPYVCRQSLSTATWKSHGSLGSFPFPLQNKWLWGSLPSPREPSCAEKIKLFSWPRGKSSKRNKKACDHHTCTIYTRTVDSSYFLKQVLPCLFPSFSFKTKEMDETQSYNLSNTFCYYWIFLLRDHLFLLPASRNKLYISMYSFYISTFLFILQIPLTKYCFNIPSCPYPLPTSQSSYYQERWFFCQNGILLFKIVSLS